MNTDQFLELLDKSGLVSEDQVDEVLAQIEPGATSSQLDDADFVGKSLVDRGLITSWHLRQLLKRRYKGFFIRQYKILGILGAGGMSTVYLAEHTVMQRRVAIKVLPKERLKKSAYLDHFVREAQVIATLDHPNIIRAYDIDREADLHYIVMEFFEGINLQKKVETEGPLAVADIVYYVFQAAEALDYAHKVGIIHRDVKPGNLLVNSANRVKLLDLGLAMIDQRLYSGNVSSNFQESSVLGTADYLAPEQAINSQNIDSRADIYALGGVLYFCLTEHPPFPSGSVSERLLAHQQKEPGSILKDRPNTAKDLVAICKKMMSKNPEDRHQTAGEVAQDLKNWLKKHGHGALFDDREESSEISEKSPSGDSRQENPKTDPPPSPFGEPAEKRDEPVKTVENTVVEKDETPPNPPPLVLSGLSLFPTSSAKHVPLPDLPPDLNLPPIPGGTKIPELPKISLPYIPPLPSPPPLSKDGKSELGPPSSLFPLPPLPGIPSPEFPPIGKIGGFPLPPLPPIPDVSSKERDEFLTQDDGLRSFGRFEDDTATTSAAGPLVFGDQNEIRVDLEETDYENAFGMKTDPDLISREEEPVDNSILFPDSSVDLGGKTDIDLEDAAKEAESKKSASPKKQTKETQSAAPSKPKPDAKPVEPPAAAKPKPVAKPVEPPAAAKPKPVAKPVEPPATAKPKPVAKPVEPPATAKPKPVAKPVEPPAPKTQSLIQVDEQLPLPLSTLKQESGTSTDTGPGSSAPPSGIVRTPVANTKEHFRPLHAGESGSSGGGSSGTHSLLTTQEQIVIQPPSSPRSDAPGKTGDSAGTTPTTTKESDIYAIAPAETHEGKSSPVSKPVAPSPAPEKSKAVRKTAKKVEKKAGPAKPLNDDEYDKMLTNFVSSAMPVKAVDENDPTVLLAMQELEKTQKDRSIPLQTEPAGPREKRGTIEGITLKAASPREREYEERTYPKPVASQFDAAAQWISYVPVWFWGIFGFSVALAIIFGLMLFLGVSSSPPPDPP